jgi:hypothetical protein
VHHSCHVHVQHRHLTTTRVCWLLPQLPLPLLLLPSLLLQQQGWQQLEHACHFAILRHCLAESQVLVLELHLR